MSEDRAPRELSRGQVIRDVMIFQAKLFMDGARDVILVPISLVAALIDVFDNSRKPGYHFYRAVRFGRETERFIHLFEAADRLEREEGEGLGLGGRSIDSMVSAVENRVVEEYKRGDLSASAKGALDRLLEELHERAQDEDAYGGPAAYGDRDDEEPR